MLFLSCSCGENSTGGSEKSEIDKKISQLCSGEIGSEELDAATECVNEKTHDLDMIMTCLEGIVSCDGIGITYCIADASICNPENCETATLNCPDSAYYHVHPQDPDGGDTYVISEALGSCTHSRSSSGGETIGTEVRACVDGECVLPSIIVERICGR